jgi:hypothetical protein
MKIRLAIVGCLLWAALFGAGCVQVQTTRLGAGPIRPPITPNQVAIYRTAEQVPSRYEEVALMSAKGAYNMTTEEVMYSEMRKKAGAMGANAVILDSIKEPTTGSKVANALLGTPANREGKAVAIFVLERDSAPAVQPVAATSAP